MLDSDSFADAVALIYEASALPETWPSAIASTATVASARPMNGRAIMIAMAMR